MRRFGIKMRTAVVLLMLGLAGCASVVRGTTEQVQFDSEPSGATMRSIVDYPCGGPCPAHDEQLGSEAAYVSTDVKTPEVPGPACVTPCTAQVARNQTLTVTFTKAGYLPQTVKLGAHISGGGAVGVAGNALIGGGIGLVVDSATGAGFDHYPNPLKVTLSPIGRAAEQGAKRPK